MRRVTALLAALLLGAALWPAPAAAAAPAQQGWWTARAAGPVGAGPSPDVPSDGLLVEGGVGSAEGADNASPTSFAALVYQVGDAGVAGPLTLSVVPGSASVPSTKLQLCPLRQPRFEPAQGGAIGDAPGFDCRTSVSAAPADDGSAYEFDVAPLLRGGVLAVAVLPTAAVDRVVLAAPGDGSLPVASAPGGTFDEVAAADDPVPSSGGPGGPTSGSSSVDAAAGFSTPALPEVPAATTPAPPSSPGTARPTAVVAGAPLASSEAGAGVSVHTRLLLVLVLGGALVVGWLAVGRSAQRRMLAELGAGPRHGR